MARSHVGFGLCMAKVVETDHPCVRERIFQRCFRATAPYGGSESPLRDTLLPSLVIKGTEHWASPGTALGNHLITETKGLNHCEDGIVLIMPVCGHSRSKKKQLEVLHSSFPNCRCC